jgi:hypothetical protein
LKRWAFLHSQLNCSVLLPYYAIPRLFGFFIASLKDFTISTPKLGSSCYKICAFSTHTNLWISADATPILDEKPNWVSYKLYERLKGSVPPATFQDVNGVCQRVPAEGTFTWYPKDDPLERRGTTFQICARNQNLSYDMGLQGNLLSQNELSVIEGAPVLLDGGNEEYSAKTEDGENGLDGKKYDPNYLNGKTELAYTYIEKKRQRRGSEHFDTPSLWRTIFLKMAMETRQQRSMTLYC